MSGGIEEAIEDGIDLPDRTGAPIRYRFLRPSDDIEAITGMLHDAYRPLADAGMRFVASHQSSSVTRQRMELGETIVAVIGTQVIGIVTWRPPGGRTSTPHFQQPDVASFGQFAVDPVFQRRGIGSQLLALVEARAAAAGIARLALDTSEHATDLIRLYARKGFRFVEHAQYDEVNYRSVVLSKALEPTTPPPAF